MNASSIRALLVDDEMLARLALRQALASHPDVSVVGECGNATEALQALATLKPDLLFLDICMAGGDGFDLLHELNPDSLPMVVFATAYGQHALRAFDANALDYLMKPVDQDRFDRTMARVRSQWHGLHAVVSGSTGLQACNARPLQRLSVRVGECIRIIATREIDWIRADGNYVHIHANGTTYLHRETLQHLQDALDPLRFLRVHRGVIVNADRVHEMHPLFNDSAELVLQDGTRLPLSRRYRTRARRALGFA